MQYTKHFVSASSELKWLHYMLEKGYLLQNYVESDVGQGLYEFHETTLKKVRYFQMLGRGDTLQGKIALMKGNGWKYVSQEGGMWHLFYIEDAALDSGFLHQQQKAVRERIKEKVFIANNFLKANAVATIFAIILGVILSSSFFYIAAFIMLFVTIKKNHELKALQKWQQFIEN